ncbi:uncharacterized protein LOC106435534 [Brassica napus]|uniref:uncharacterized protein LOC106435534 n=1 Tax=Brassica napus TaxID=3708 RepID=UPI0006AB42F4|nr:uncharacterized protein LOC106435534 [Brassica napus]
MEAAGWLAGLRTTILQSTTREKAGFSKLSSVKESSQTADYSRASEQQEADSAASKGCGIFEFLKKKPEDVPSSDVTKENKGEEKPSLAERIPLFDSSSSSDEESGENGEVKEKKRKKAEGEGVLSQQGR